MDRERITETASHSKHAGPRLDGASRAGLAVLVVLAFFLLAASAGARDRGERDGAASARARHRGEGDGAASASANHRGDGNAGSRAAYCSQTAALQLAGCLAEITDDKFVGQAICLNFSDEDEAKECKDDLAEDFRAGQKLCRDQYDARKDLCKDERIGEGRYDPSFDPEDFETEFTSLNLYLPLQVGNSWSYANEDETDTVTVLDEKKLIDGVTCIVVRDVVEEDGVLIEDTDDWFGQRSNGTVDYCGEEAKDYETFDGDMPPLPELIEIEGSFKAGRDGDKSGTLFLGTPVVGAKYRQEWSPNNAEDVAEVLSTGYGPGAPDDRFDGLVPEELLEIMCGDDDCAVTEDTTPIEPDVIEYKFYAYGVGVFFEVNPEEGEALSIVECEVNNAVGDAKCDALPDPEE